LPVAYISRLLSKAENYFTIKKKLLAIVYSVQFFRSYVYGRKFTLVTNHQLLKWLHSMKDSTLRLVRWRLKIVKYEYDIVYKAGKINRNADALSRNPISVLSFGTSKISDLRALLSTAPYKRKRRRKYETTSNIPAKGTQCDNAIAITDNDAGTKCRFSTPVPASDDSENPIHRRKTSGAIERAIA